eukprot:Platyproteum_vivax@DN6821_c0_g1_i2.p2
MMLHLTYLCVVSFVIYGAFCNESCDLNSPFSILTCPNGGGGILLQGGTVVNEASMEQADVWVCGEVVERVQKHMKIPAGAEVIDVTNKYVLPGGNDASDDQEGHKLLQVFYGLQGRPDGERRTAVGGISPSEEARCPGPSSRRERGRRVSGPRGSV